MKLYKHWVKETGTLLIGGQIEKASFYGKSNISPEDARRDAASQCKVIQAKINGEGMGKGEYEVAIREEIVRRLNDHNLVTRNRYGAQVLNSEDVFFVDMDEPPQKGFLRSLFGGGTKGSPKEQILVAARAQASKSKYRTMGFRLYETSAGIRMIVQGHGFDCGNQAAMKLMRDYNADPLYALLCAKQACFRARLTPKPYRMKCKGHRVVFPRTPQQDDEMTRWLETYESMSQNFSVCKHVTDLGPFRETEAVRYHDQVTGAKQQKPLA